MLERMERRRAEAIRREPDRLVHDLRAARRILVLCQGNVIRSVFAARLMSVGLESRSVTVRSAGLETVAGWPAHPQVRARCAGLHLDLGDHASAIATRTMVDGADVILVMEVSQLVVVWRRFPGARRKTYLLSSLAPDVPLEIPDPAGQGEAAVETCLDQVARAVERMLGIITDRTPGAAAGRDGRPEHWSPVVE